jgi:mono/diheme cytochrome c family protein
MRWIYFVLTVVVVAAANLIAQDVYLKIPADPPTKNPLQGNADAITAGMGAYRVRCADCHGMDARGIRGPDISQVWARGRTDAALFRTIRNGVPNTEMPAHPAPRTSDMDIWRILAYLKTISPATGAAPGGRQRRGRRARVRHQLRRMSSHRRSRRQSRSRSLAHRRRTGARGDGASDSRHDGELQNRL